jgi:hypothetical protein
MTTEMAGNALRALNEAFAGATPDDKDVPWKASASMHVNSDSTSNEIDESELQK